MKLGLCMVRTLCFFLTRSEITTSICITMLVTPYSPPATFAGYGRVPPDLTPFLTRKICPSWCLIVNNKKWFLKRKNIGFPYWNYLNFKESISVLHFWFSGLGTPMRHATPHLKRCRPHRNFFVQLYVLIESKLSAFCGELAATHVSNFLY